MDPNIDKICSYIEVRISIPRHKINNTYPKSNYLTHQETVFFRAKKSALEKKIAQLNHVLSLVDKILLREDSPERPHLTQPT